MRTTIGFFLGLLALQAPHWMATAPVDIAIDPERGLTYLQTSAKNTGGKIVVIDHVNRKPRHEFFVETSTAEGSRYEIEVAANGKVFYLVQQKAGPSIFGVIELQTNGTYETTEIAGTLDSLESPHSLKAEANGGFSIESKDTKTGKTFVSFFSVTQEDGHWRTQKTFETKTGYEIASVHPGST